MQAIITHEAGSGPLVAKEIHLWKLAIHSQEPTQTRAEGDLNELLAFSYFGQSITQVSLIIATATKDTINQAMMTIPWHEYIGSDRTFKCVIDPTLFPHQAIEHIMTTTKATVRLQEPNIVIRIITNNEKAYICLDCCNQVLYKREYKVFNNPASLRATLGYQTLLACDFAPGKTIVDPFCGAGTIPIEAGIANSGKGPHNYQKEKFCFRYWKTITPQLFEKITAPRKAKDGAVFGYDWNITAIKAAQKNASIADINVQWGKIEVNYLPSKFDDDTVDCIASHPPAFNKKDIGQKLHKHLHELFVGAGMLLKKQGKLAIITNDIVQLLQIENPLKHSVTHTVECGQTPVFIVVFSKT